MTEPILHGRFVVVRTFSAGVHVGTLIHMEGREVRLADARRVWRWAGANTLSELSQKGAAQEYTRISQPVPEIILTEAIEVILCSDVARENLSLSRWSDD